MNWDAIGALAELFGAVGVIVTLLFLVRQIQQNTRALRATTNHALNQQKTDVNLRIGLDPDAAEFLFRGMRCRDELEPHERARHTLLLRAVVGYYEDAYVQFREGLLDIETWEVSKFALGQVVSEPDFAGWWTLNRNGYRSGFRVEVDALLGDA
jgi:hypothetical protein